MAHKRTTTTSLLASGAINEDELVINDDNYHEHVEPVVNGEVKKRGLIARNFKAIPVGSLPCARPFDLPLIPESEWQQRLDAQLTAKARLSDIRDRSGPGGGPIPSTDQNGRGYCWCHSWVSAVLLTRAVNNQPFVDLSAYMVGCLVKSYRDQGGWGTEGIEFMAEHGVPDSKFWPQRSASRSNDTPAMRANAKLHRVTEWMDFGSQQMWTMQVTCALLGIPVAVCYNWWGHSVCQMDVVSLSPRRVRIWNSWGDSWSSNGAGILEGNKALADGAIAPRVVSPSQDFWRKIKKRR